MKKNSGIYQYLEHTGVLEHGTAEDITNARNAYWRDFRRTYQQNRRSQIVKETTLSFTLDEFKRIAKDAAIHHTNRTSFTKQAALAYMTRRYIVPDSKAVGHIRQLLAMNYTLLQEIIEANIVTVETGKALLQKIFDLEHTVLSQLQSPQTIEQWIAETVQTDPDSKAQLSAFLNTL